MTSSCLAPYRALRDLEAYAEQAVAKGGVDPKIDSTWIALASAVHSRHETWAQERKLPTLENLRHWKVRLETWERNLTFNLADHRRAAEWLCHVDIVKSLADWPLEVHEPLESWWQPNVRPWEILVPDAAWQAANGHIEDDSWIVETAATLRHYEPVMRAAQPHLVACQRESDFVATLPGRLVQGWLHRSGRWPIYAKLIEDRVEELEQQKSNTLEEFGSL